MAATDVLFDVAPEFFTTDTSALARVSRFLGYAQQSVNSVSYGTNFSLATAYMAAHMLTMSARAGVGGAITMNEVGPFRQSFAAPGDKGGASDLMQTSYGRALLALRNQVSRTPLLT